MDEKKKEDGKVDRSAEIVRIEQAIQKWSRTGDELLKTTSIIIDMWNGCKIELINIDRPPAELVYEIGRILEGEVEIEDKIGALFKLGVCKCKIEKIHPVIEFGLTRIRVSIDIISHSWYIGTLLEYKHGNDNEFIYPTLMVDIPWKDGYSGLFTQKEE